MRSKNSKDTAHHPASLPANSKVPIWERISSILPEEGIRRPRETAAISKGVFIIGDIYSQEPLYVNGEIEGTLELPDHRLTVGPNGELRATVLAKEVVVLGSIHGNVEASKIIIRKNAKLAGDIKTASIVIEEGAYFKGNIDIMKSEGKTSSPLLETEVRASKGAAVGAFDGRR